MSLGSLTSQTFDVPSAPELMNAYFAERCWTDGLPILPPTEERVRLMLSQTRGAPDELIGRIPPKWGPATLEKIAINAVMAGCEPAYLPVVVAAVEAMLQPQFNLYGVQATTHPVAPLAIVNGPLAKELRINGGSGAFGPGWPANATIGRALRLVLLNLGGAWPGVSDMASQGSPAKYGYCIAENEDASPWEPLHVQLGFARNESVVTMFGGESPHNVNDHVSTNGPRILNLVADAMSTPGSNPAWYLNTGQWLIGLGPEHAATIARDGFSKSDVQRYLFERARIPLAKARESGMWGMHEWPTWLTALNRDDDRIPVASRPEDLVVIVVGGPGKHSVVIPNATINRIASKQVDRPVNPTSSDLSAG
ncbi:MAG: hypothetical protein HY329_19840 [Chloroflexi bacterium]|nr:hypothetical protein [Chloroflexota bacterium]